MLRLKRLHYVCISPTLKSLHWLSIQYRIHFKIVLLTFKALHGLAPGYLSAMIHMYNPSRCLRSSDKTLLQVPSTRLKTYGDRSFAKAAPALWNELPLRIRKIDDIHVFKSELKTFLFNKCYTDN